MSEIDTTQLDPAFYVWSAGAEEVWSAEGNPFYVVRNGEMRIHAEDDEGAEYVLRYTDRLMEFGIKNDEQLAEWSAKPIEKFDWVNNAWFEVWTNKDPDYYSEPFHDLLEAKKYAEELFAEFPNGVVG